MIVLVVGDFGVGKDTVADELVHISNTQDKSVMGYDYGEFVKIISYTTRSPRSVDEDTHIFVNLSDFYNSNDILAQTKIGDNYYWTEKHQFHKDMVSVYCVDDQGVKDVTEADIDDVFIVEVIRPKWLIDLPEERLNRERHYEPYKYQPDYRIMNDGDMMKLKVLVWECFVYIVKTMKDREPSINLKKPL